MQDQPTPGEILAAVARFLKEEVAPATAGHLSFQARVAANALEMMRRQLDLAPAEEAAERARLTALLGMDGDLAALNEELSHRIAAGEMDLATLGLADHLWAVTLAKLAVDQPTYAAYRAELAERTKDSLPVGVGEVPAKPGKGARLGASVDAKLEPPPPHSAVPLPQRGRRD